MKVIRDRICDAVHKCLQWEDGEIGGIDMLKLEQHIDGILAQLQQHSVGGPSSASGSEGEQLGNEAGAQGVCACPHEDPEPSERMGSRVCHICNRDRY